MEIQDVPVSSSSSNIRQTYQDSDMHRISLPVSPWKTKIIHHLLFREIRKKWKWKSTNDKKKKCERKIGSKQQKNICLMCTNITAEKSTQVTSVGESPMRRTVARFEGFEAQIKRKSYTKEKSQRKEKREIHRNSQKPFFFPFLKCILATRSALVVVSRAALPPIGARTLEILEK